VPEGTTLFFGSWACTADGSRGFSSHLVTPNSPELKTINQPAEICETAELDGKRAPFEFSSDIVENVSTPSQTHKSVEFDTNSDSKKLHFSETHKKYMTYLKSIKRPKIVNHELLDGVDRVSRSIEGSIKLVESVLGSSKLQQNPEALNPPQERLGDIPSGIDRVDSNLIDCIKMTVSTLQNKKLNLGGGNCGKAGKKNPRLARMGPSSSRKPQNPSPKLAHSWIPKPTDTSDSLFEQDFDHFMNSRDNFEPFDDLEDWSDNVDLFMDAMAHPP